MIIEGTNPGSGEQHQSVGERMAKIRQNLLRKGHNKDEIRAKMNDAVARKEAEENQREREHKMLARAEHQGKVLSNLDSSLWNLVETFSEQQPEAIRLAEQATLSALSQVAEQLDSLDPDSGDGSLYVEQIWQKLSKLARTINIPKESPVTKMLNRLSIKAAFAHERVMAAVQPDYDLLQEDFNKALANLEDRPKLLINNLDFAFAVGRMAALIDSLDAANNREFLEKRGEDLEKIIKELRPEVINRQFDDEGRVTKTIWGPNRYSDTFVFLPLAELDDVIARKLGQVSTARHLPSVHDRYQLGAEVPPYQGEADSPRPTKDNPLNLRQSGQAPDLTDMISGQYKHYLEKWAEHRAEELVKIAGTPAQRAERDKKERTALGAPRELPENMVIKGGEWGLGSAADRIQQIKNEADARYGQARTEWYRELSAARKQSPPDTETMKRLQRQIDVSRAQEAAEVMAEISKLKQEAGLPQLEAALRNSRLPQFLRELVLGDPQKGEEPLEIKFKAGGGTNWDIQHLLHQVQSQDPMDYESAKNPLPRVNVRVHNVSETPKRVFRGEAKPVRPVESIEGPTDEATQVEQGMAIIRALLEQGSVENSETPTLGGGLIIDDIDLGALNLDEIDFGDPGSLAGFDFEDIA